MRKVSRFIDDPAARFGLRCVPATYEDAEKITGFAQRLFFRQPRSDTEHGVWWFDEQPHRVVTLDRLRSPPGIGHLTGETAKGGDALNAVFDQLPEDTVLCLTLLITP